MSSAVLAISIGPVQDFIAQARRSRDLWFGSHALSEIARAAAVEAFAAGAETLVFPAVEPGDAELAPCDAPLREDGTPPLNIGNLVLLMVPADRAAEIAGRMQQAAASRWRGLADQVREARDVQPLLADEIDAIWNEQIDTLLEIYAACCPIGGDTPYPNARENCMAALAARKNLREFTPWMYDRAGAPKSSFDGGRVSVLGKSSDRNGFAAGSRRRFRLLDGEQLDAVGLVKRCGGKPEQFVPLANVALASWIDRCRRRKPEAVEELCSLCERHGIQRVARRDLGWLGWRADGLAFDAEVLLPGRLQSTLADYGVEDPAVIEQFKAAVARLTARDGGGSPPIPHVCCLVADGDRMGVALGELADPERHRELSRRLARFAGQAREIVNEHGFTVYAGGDDVLGFVSPAASLATAEKLRDAFATAVGEVEGLRTRPTLAVGLGIGHIFDGMAHLLELGRQAERVAKGNGESDPRDALGIIVDRRSGGTTGFRGRWQTDPAGRIRTLAGLIDRGTLPMGKIHEVKRMLGRLPKIAEAGPEYAARFTKVLSGEVRRILGRSGGDDPRTDKLTPATVLLDLAEPAEGGRYADCHRAVTAWVNACLVAREFRGPARREEGTDG